MSASVVRSVSFFVVCSLLACLFAQASLAQLVDPAAESLRSWNDCATKRALVDYASLGSSDGVAGSIDESLGVGLWGKLAA